MNLLQIDLLFSLAVHTYVLTCETGYWSIFIYVRMTGCVKCHVYFSTFVFPNESWFFLSRVLSFIIYWCGMVRRKLTIPERWQAVGMPTCTWTVSNIPRLTKALHQSYNDGMFNHEMVCHPSMAKTTVMHANSLPPFWYG
jgi:hypothetical protein